MKKTITNSQDIIDSRDVISRIADLQASSAEPDFSEDEQEELAALLALAAEGESSPDWEYGEALIHTDYFVTYAQELAEDCCDLPSPNQWPASCIDWDQAARELELDYTTINFDGTDYLIRA